MTREGFRPTVRANARTDARRGHEVRAGWLTGEPCGFQTGLPLWTARKFGLTLGAGDRAVPPTGLPPMTPPVTEGREES